MLFGYTRMHPATAGSRSFLYFAAAFNFGGAALLATLARMAPEMLGMGAPPPGALLFVDLAAVLIAVFGVGYALGGRDLVRLWPCVALGALSKAGVAVLVVACALGGEVAPLFLAVAVADATFAVLFIRLLRSHAAG
jgi:hypothetical protein